MPLLHLRDMSLIGGKVDDFRRIGEGYILFAIVIFGASANLFSLLIIRNRELNLIRNFSRLLQMQAGYDLGYLLSNLVIFVMPTLAMDKSPEMDSLRHDFLTYLPYVSPLLHIFLTGSIYTTVALALERLSAMKLPNSRAVRRRRQQLHNRLSGENQDLTTSCVTVVAEEYPMLRVFVSIAVFSVCFNLPRFFEMQLSFHKEMGPMKVNSTGFYHVDYALVTVRILKGLHSTF